MIALLLLVAAFLAFAAGVFWKERTTQAIALGLALWTLSLLVGPVLHL